MVGRLVMVVVVVAEGHGGERKKKCSKTGKKLVF